jgi:filamentous hemagglutinin family protein
MTANPTRRGFCSPRRSASRRTALATLLASTALAPAALSDALPSGGQVAAGAAAISAEGNAMTIMQGSDRAVIRWDGFSVGTGARVDVRQPGPGSALLNRVTGALPSRIDGSLSANGQVFLVNPSGIVVGPGGRVDAAAFVASTLQIGEADFMAGRLRFGGDGSSAEVRNEGVIEIGRGGYAALLGGQVVNSGRISVPFGRVGLGAGEQATLDLSGDGFLQVAVPSGSAAEEALIDQTGRIDAPGGRVEISAATARDAARHAINLSGVVEARSVAQVGGAIVLGGGPGGHVTVSGRLDVSAAIETSPVPKPRPSGGSVTITGETIALDGARVAADGPGGGGEIRIGGDRKGGGDLHRARTLSETGSTITADATVAGGGGRVILWSDDATLFTGSISARGGPQGGDGGFVEVSGRRNLAFAGQVDTRAPMGATGMLLLDPASFLIVDGPLIDPPFNVLATESIEAALATTGVTIDTSSADIDGDPGDITLQGEIAWTSGSELYFLADNDVVLNGAVTGPSGTFRISAGGDVVSGPGGAVNVGGFVLESGDWAQTDPALPAFSADNFYIFPEASFLRAGGGTGTIADPYILRDVYGLQGIGTAPALLASNWRLGNAIDASGTSGWDPSVFVGSVFETGFAPIGGFTAFTGSLDGAGLTISGLTVSNAFAGLFGSIGTGGRVSDLTLAAVSITDGSGGFGSAGGLAQQNSGTISGVTVTGSVGAFGSDGDVAAVGGIAGINTATGVIQASVFDGSILVPFGFGSEVGGLVGRNDGSVSGSRSGGAITVGSVDDAVVGGLAGTNTGTIAASRSTASVTVDATSFEGSFGIVGGFVGVNSGSISASWAQGTVETFAVGGDIGGFAGRNESTGVISRARSDGDVLADNPDGTLDVGGFIGENRGIARQTDAHGDVVVTGSESFGFVAAGGHTGGLFGGLVEDSFARGAVSVSGVSSQVVGGFIGRADGGAVRRSYASGTIASGPVQGGFIGGVVEMAPAVEGAFWDVTTSGLTTSAGGTGLTTAQFQDTLGFIALAAPLGWSFTNPVWAPGAPGLYPSLYATTPILFALPDDASGVQGALGPGTLTGQVFGGPSLYVLGVPGDTLDTSGLFVSPGFPSGAPGLYPVTALSGIASAGGTFYTVVSGTASLTVLPAPGDGGGTAINILPSLLPTSLPNPEDVILGIDGSLLAEAEAALRNLERVAQTLAADIEICRQSEPTIGDSLGCIAEALNRLAATLESIRLQLPPPLQNVSSVIETARQDIEAARGRAEARLATATTAEERDAIAREAIGEARAALAVASDEIRKSIALIRAEDPELTRLQVEQGNAILASLRAVDNELQRAVGL